MCFTLGGSCSEADTTKAASDILAFISTSNSGAARNAANSCKDSSGNFGSGTVSLQVSAINTVDKASTTAAQGFYWTAGTSAAYCDGAGSYYAITIDPVQGTTTFTHQGTSASTTDFNG